MPAQHEKNVRPKCLQHNPEKSPSLDSLLSPVKSHRSTYGGRVNIPQLHDSFSSFFTFLQATPFLVAITLRNHCSKIYLQNLLYQNQEENQNPDSVGVKWIQCKSWPVVRTSMVALPYKAYPDATLWRPLSKMSSTFTSPERAKDEVLIVCWRGSKFCVQDGKSRDGSLKDCFRDFFQRNRSSPSPRLLCFLNKGNFRFNLVNLNLKI